MSETVECPTTTDGNHVWAKTYENGSDISHCYVCGVDADEAQIAAEKAAKND